MSEPMELDPTQLLRAHVEATLAASGVPASDREDVAEELYGHLWQRWRDEVAAGASASEAVESAVRSFGDAGRIGFQMTAAFHSRLYATTIGALLPAAVAPEGRPSGYRRLRLLLLLSAMMELVMAWIGLTLLTPGRAAVLVAAALVTFALDALAYRAFGRGQRWALRYCQFVLATVLVAGAASVFTATPNGVTVPIVGLIGLWMLGPAIGGEMADWFSHSRPIGRGLAVALVTATMAGFLLPMAAPVLPDPTQVTAADLDLRVTATCTRDASGGVKAMDLETRLRWGRLDLFPGGLGHASVQQWQDGLLPLIPTTGGKATQGGAGQPIAGPRWPGYQLDPSEPTVASPDGSVADAVNFQMPEGLVPAFPDVAMPQGLEFAVGGLHAGWTYDIVYHYRWASDTPAPTDPSMTVWYVHLDRFAVQALASCALPGSGVPVDLPPAAVSQ
jgi:hypothetical protein